MELIQSVMSVLGPFTGVRRPGTTQPARPGTTPDPNYVPPRPEPAVPPPRPGNTIRPFPRPTVPQQPALPGASINQQRLQGSKTIDVTPTASQTVRRGDRGGILEFLGSGSARRAKSSFAAQEREALKGYDNRQLFDIVNDRMMPKSTRDAARDLLNRDMQRNVLNDPTAQQGPLGPQASATTVIQPIIIFKDPPTA